MTIDLAYSGSQRSGIRSATPAKGAKDCAVPVTLRNLKEDLKDLGSRFDGRRSF